MAKSWLEADEKYPHDLEVCSLRILGNLSPVPPQPSTASAQLHGLEIAGNVSLGNPGASFSAVSDSNGKLRKYFELR